MDYVFWGKVIKGKSRGKDLGFRTANVRLAKAITEGVYVSECKIKGKMYEAVSFVGAAETFGETEVFAETYIFDFDKDIYGRWISIRLLKRIRGSRKFESRDELIEAIERDVEESRAYFRGR